MALLTEAAIQEFLGNSDGWELSDGNIVRTFTFNDFQEAMTFVNRVAEAAEEVDHHPDIDIRWNRVRLALSTHSEGGLTVRDISLASVINSLNG